jgi:diaminopimelate epimerase
MSPLADRPFFKMNGLGNEIVVLDLRGTDIRVTAEEARAVAADPRLRFDQMMVLHDPVTAGTRAYVLIYNVDGTFAGACGNGTRCVAWALTRDLPAHEANAPFHVETVRGLLECRKQGDWTFAVDMGAPRFQWSEIPLAGPAPDLRALDVGVVGLPPAVAVNMGNPHAVFFVPDAEAINLERMGRAVETSPLFPDRVNVSFAQILAPDRVLLRVWERGAGATRACGSASCATLVAGALRGLLARAATISLPGGDLQVDWRADDHVMMTGPVELEFAERFAPALFERLA